MPPSAGLLDTEALAGFADALRRSAPPVANAMGPGLSEDRISTLCAEASLTPSRDAITWFTFWDARPLEARPSTASRFGEVLPGFQSLPLASGISGSMVHRRFAEDSVSDLREPGIGAEDLWPRHWLSMFVDGGGTTTILDCGAPNEPSLLRDCFRESFAGPEWGRPIASLAAWVQNGTEWMTSGLCRFDADRDQWLPLDAARAYWPSFDITAEANPPLFGSRD